MSLRWTLISLCLGAATSTACSGTSTLTAPSATSSLRILALSPGAGETLPRGADVSLSLTVTSESPGRLTLSIRDQDGTRLLTAEPTIELLARQETNIRASFAVPVVASSIDVLADVRTAGVASSTVLHVGYIAR